MNPIEVLAEARRFYESQFDDEFDADEAARLIVEAQDAKV